MSGILETIRKSVGIYRSHGALFTGYAAWLLLPYAGLVLAELLPNEDLSFITSLCIVAGLVVLSFWITAAMTLAARDIIEGREPDPTAISQATKRLVSPMALVALLYGVIVLGGTLLFIIPGLVFAVWYCFSVNMSLLEGKRGMEALSGSRELVRGRFWRIAFSVFGGKLVISAAFYLVVSLVIIGIATGTGTPLLDLIGDHPPLWSDVLSTVGEVFLMPVTTIYLTLVYLEAKKPYV